MNSKFNSRKWVAYIWYMVLVTLTIVLAFVSAIVGYEYPRALTDILMWAGLVTAGYCGFNVLNKKFTVFDKDAEREEGENEQ